MRTELRKEVMILICIRGSLPMNEKHYKAQYEYLQREGFISPDQEMGVYRPTREGRKEAERLLIGDKYVSTEEFIALTSENPTPQQKNLAKNLHSLYDFKKVG